jgi:tRNA(Ile)-lysidine synthase
MTHQPVPKLIERLVAAWSPSQWSDLTVLVAVSGGADSVALLRALVESRRRGPGRIVVAHFHHGLRGKAAGDDARFTADLAQQLELPCELGQADAGAFDRAGGDGVEAAARRARYEFLRQTAGRVGARYVATGHTADDQAETILQRILRGTGVAGLAGIPVVRLLSPELTIVRPILSVRRDEVLAYLAARDQPFCSDATNNEPRFTRNRIRHDLLPHLADHYNPAVIDALLRMGRLAGEAHGVIAALAAELADRCVAPVEHRGVRIDPVPLADQPDYVVREVLIAAWRSQGWTEQDMGLAEWEGLLEILLRGAPARTLPGGIQAQMEAGRLVLAPGIADVDGVDF